MTSLSHNAMFAASNALIPLEIILAISVLSATGAAQEKKPGKVHDVPKKGLTIKGKLTKDSPKLAALRNSPHGVHRVRLSKGQSYVVDLTSKDFDSFLIFAQGDGKVVSYDNDGGQGRDSQLLIYRSAGGVHLFLAAALDKRPGAFQLKVRLSTLSKKQLAAAAEKLNFLGVRTLRGGDAAQAARMLRHAHEICRKLHTDPQGHPNLATSFHNLGAALQRLGKLKESRSHYRRAATIRRTVYPNGHPELAASLNNLGDVHLQLGELEQALVFFQESLAVMRKLFPATRYPNGQPGIAQILANHGRVLRLMGRADRALVFHHESLAMFRKLFPVESHPNGRVEIADVLASLGLTAWDAGKAQQALQFHLRCLEMRRKLYPDSRLVDGHPDLATSLHNVAFVLHNTGQREKAFGYYQQALAMRRKLYPASRYPDGHADLAGSLNSMGSVLRSLGQANRALRFHLPALAMKRRLYPAAKYPDGHAELVYSLNNLGVALRETGQNKEALPYVEKSLAMCRKLYPASRYPHGHPELATSLNNLAMLLHALGRSRQALLLLNQTLAMKRKLYPVAIFPGGHRELAGSLNNLGHVLQWTGQEGKAEPILKQSLAMQQHLLRSELHAATEDAAFERVAVEPATRDAYLSVTRSLGGSADAVYRAVWPSRSMLTRILLQRHASARAAGAAMKEKIERVIANRRETERLLREFRLDPGKRDQQLRKLADDRDKRERELIAAIPVLKRWQQLDRLGPDDLIKALPAHTVFVDLISYFRFDPAAQHDTNAPVRAVPGYVAFILAQGQPVRRIELNEAKAVNAAVADWRAAIEARRADRAAGHRVRDLVWSKIEAALPRGTKSIYFVADSDLARLPWAALPTKKDRVLLEDYSLAVVPHGTFLLESRKFPRKVTPSSAALLMGGIDYSSKSWPNLPGTKKEIEALARLGARNTSVLTTGLATRKRLVEQLPNVRYAHLATHGFFAAKALAAEKKRALAARSRIGLASEQRLVAAKNPLGYVGLVLAKGELVSGLSLVDLSLNNVGLVTLSACETGLGEFTGGAGVQNLQHAFHLAGCPNVVASLWQVNDDSTAALMSVFYHELWVKEKPPIEALRTAQLALYYHPEKINDLSATRGPAFDTTVKIVVRKPPRSSLKRTPTKLWAGFVLSGLGQ